MDDVPHSTSRAADDADKALVLAAIRKAAAENGGLPPPEFQFRRATGIPAYMWRGRYWTRWSDALSDAGIVSPRIAAKNDEYLLSKLAAALRHYQRVPTATELNHYARIFPGFPAQATLTRRFQGKRQMIDTLRRWAEAKPDMADIAGFCARDRNASVRRDELPAVYLLRSGEFYKIGWTHTLVQRIDDLQNGLPEPAELMHVIRTVDPRGIEAMWHRRFAARRVKGEWFRLTPDDIAAFCKESHP